MKFEIGEVKFGYAKLRSNMVSGWNQLYTLDLLYYDLGSLQKKAEIIYL